MDRITVKSVYVKHELLRLRVLFGHGLSGEYYENEQLAHYVLIGLTQPLVTVSISFP